MSNINMRAKFQKNEENCIYCGSADVDWHHCTYRSEGGSDNTDNLTPICHPCHVSLHSERGDFRKWGKQGGKRTAANPTNWQRNLKQFRVRT